MVCPIFAVLVPALAPAGAWAETYEVKMLNRNSTGPMPFEPDFLKLKPGDKVKFLAKSNGHNANSIDGMMPPGAKPFKGKLNEEIVVEFTAEGFHGIGCTPHYAEGMVMLILVGEGNLEDVKIAETLPEPSKKRFREIIERVKAKE
jgi:pseudoazurin